MRRRFSTFDWNSCIDVNIERYVQNCTDVITKISSDCIPNYIANTRSGEPPWINGTIKQKIRKRKRAFRKARLSNSQHHWWVFKQLRNEIVSLIRQAKRTHINSLATKLKSGSLYSRDWWTTLKSFIKPSSSAGIPVLIDPSSGDEVISNDEKAHLLNKFFSSQATLDDSSHHLPVITHNQSAELLESIIIQPSELLDVMRSLPLGKASGPDGINNRILLEAAAELSVPLCQLFNHSLHVKIMPQLWKCPNVCAVFKKGDPSSPSNYRPISLLNTIEKVFERIVFKHVFNHLRDTQFFTPHQSGFLPGDSTVNQLTYLYDMFCKALDNGLEVRVIFFDISKAFDKVWHRGLLLKLENAGIRGNLLLWFTNYLHQRRQCVVLPGTSSTTLPISAGVPQGSILGPLLFLVFINDIVREIQSNINLFADDTSLFLVVDNPADDAKQLQSDINKISSWADTWLVKFNPSKSECLIISRKRLRPAHPTLHMYDTDIPTVEDHKHLGIIFSSNGSWHSHIRYIKEKAWRRINILRQLKHLLDRKSLEIIYFSFIRPILEYGGIVWNNCSLSEKDEIDKIQHEAERIVTGCTRLVSLHFLHIESGWESLGTRREKQALILFHKMHHGTAPNYLSQLCPVTVGSCKTRTLRNSSDLMPMHARTSLYMNSFLPSTTRSWNALPLEVRNIAGDSSFKTHLNSEKIPVSRLFYFGCRRSQVLHTRLRTDCSALKHHLFAKNIVDSPLCSCGSLETTYHYLFVCRNYSAIRNVMLDTVSRITEPNLRLLLYGDVNLSPTENELVFRVVHKYIESTKRFSDGSNV